MKHAERPALRRWTRREYERLIDHGFLDEDEPIELLDGLLLVKEPQSSPHRTAVLLVAKTLERAFGDGWFVQVRSEEHTSELQSLTNLVCRLLLEKKKERRTAGRWRQPARYCRMRG